MAYDDVERSAEAGEPAELYEFTGPDLLVRQTTGTEAVDLGGGEVYEPAAIVRGQAEVSGDHNSQPDLQVTVPLDHPVAVLFRVAAPRSDVSLRIVRKHASDPETEGAWLGFVRFVTVSGDVATLHCAPIPDSFRREGLRTGYERRCPYHVYEPNTCRAVIADFTVSAILSAVDGATIEAPAFAALPTGWLAGGEVLFEGRHQLVTAHAGAVVTLLVPIFGLAPGSEVTATAGCDRLRTTCDDKFDNLVNFGGFPWMPTKNPFGVGLDG